MPTFLLGNGITLSKTDLAPQSQGNEKIVIIVQNIKWLNKEINNEVTTLCPSHPIRKKQAVVPAAPFAANGPERMLILF